MSLIALYRLLLKYCYRDKWSFKYVMLKLWEFNIAFKVTNILEKKLRNTKCYSCNFWFKNYLVFTERAKSV